MGRGATTNSIPEIENARFLLVIGSNTTEAHPVLALRIKKAVRNGATLVVADPRAIWLTKLAKRHLQLRPGSDVWLLNAIMHVILEEGLQDDAYIAEHCEDFDAVREVVARYTPEDAERVTGVPAEAIRATAREYATERHAAIFYTLGITEHACGVDNIWSLANLVLMTGHLGYESTGLNALRGQNNVQGLNDSGANPHYFPGYQPWDDPDVRAKFAAAWGVDLPERAGYRLDQIVGKGSFGDVYRAWDATLAQNKARKDTPLTMPVLAIGGDKSFGLTMAAVMRFAATDVTPLVISDSGHWLMEEQPEATVSAVRAFIDTK